MSKTTSTRQGGADMEAGRRGKGKSESLGLQWQTASGGNTVKSERMEVTEGTNTDTQKSTQRNTLERCLLQLFTQQILELRPLPCPREETDPLVSGRAIGPGLWNPTRMSWPLHLATGAFTRTDV